MILWGFIFLVGGFLTALILFLSNLDLFSKMKDLGFGGYVQAFFDKAQLSTGKVIFLIAVVAFILGLVLYLVGRAKCKAENNPIVPAKVTKFFRDTKGEFKKIVWPTFPSVVKNTGVTLAMCALTAVIIIVVDLGLGQLVNLLLNL